ncbi:MAG: site-specific integrase, partial [Actinobacteria bacterium]|nr:site-specific integrase [Actinomycetota bacterium]
SYLNQRKENYRNENLRDLLIIHLGIDCGLRKSEMLNLKWKDIDFTNNMISIKMSKGGKSRKVPFNAEIKQLLLGYRKRTKQNTSKVIKGSFGKKITSCSLQNIIIGIYEKSGIYREGLCIHSLRHSYAERLRKKGTDIATIAKLLGHSRIDTTQAYFHISDDDIKNAVL